MQPDRVVCVRPGGVVRGVPQHNGGVRRTMGDITLRDYLASAYSLRRVQPHPAARTSRGIGLVIGVSIAGHGDAVGDSDAIDHPVINRIKALVEAQVRGLQLVGGSADDW